MEGSGLGVWPTHALPLPLFPCSSIKVRSTVFEDALYAMATEDHTLLTSYLGQHQVVNSQDSSGNTLLHYAVALSQPHTVRILCSQ